MQGAVAAKDLDTIEDVVASSGSDAATVICFLHPGLDGQQPGACPTLYYRDVGPTYSAAQVSEYRLWVALEAASGVLSEHQGSPTAVFGARQGSWNVTMDPSLDDGKESPLWAFARSRALNRLALRTKLGVSSAAVDQPEELPDPIAGYTVFGQSNCYNEGHGGTVLPGPTRGQTAASCAALCTANEKCDCVTFQARAGNLPGKVGDCWPRGGCEPAKFEHDNRTHCYDVYVKKTPPPPPPSPSPPSPPAPSPSRSGGVIAYLKHDALGPHGDAAVQRLRHRFGDISHAFLSSVPPNAHAV